MYRMDRHDRQATSLGRRAAWATLAAALAFSAGCGDDSAEPVEAPANEPSTRADTSTPPRTPDPCDLPAETIDEKPWVRNIPC